MTLLQMLTPRQAEVVLAPAPGESPTAQCRPDAGEQTLSVLLAGSIAVTLRKRRIGT